MATTSSSGSRDYYAGMPDWQKEQLMGDAAWEGEFRDAMSNVANAAAGNPRDIAGVTGREMLAMENQNAATKAVSSGVNGLLRDVDGASMAGNLGNIKDPTGMGKVHQLGDFQTTDAPTSDFNTISGPQAADVGALRGSYESGYTDNVVNTTLAGMTREAQRAQLARDAKNAAIGGTSNSRSAVADAVAGQLTGMNMAQTEAGLRDKAFNTAATFGLQEADMANKFGLDSAEFAASQEELKRKYGLDLANFGLSQEMARTDYETGRAAQSLAEQKTRAENSLAMAGFSLDEAIAQAAQGNAAAQFALDKAGVSEDLLKTQYGARMDTANRQQGLGETQREINQQQIDSEYYGGMEAGSWLSDVYSGSRTRDAAPYNYTETETQETEEDEPNRWQQFVSGAAAGLSQFL
jgi:hypothetical protein